MSGRELPADLEAARAELGRLDRVEVIRDLEWDDHEERWALLCRLNLPDGQGVIPARTAWWVLIEPTYPWGAIDIYPAVEGGIEETYPHQLLSLDRAGRPWRSGKICVDTAVRALGPVVDPEPYDALERLAWHLNRALEWLSAADRGELIVAGEPFELPDYDPPSHPIVAFWEDQQSYDHWRRSDETRGSVRLVSVRNKPEVVVVRSFVREDGNELFAPNWGSHIREIQDRDHTGIWLRLPQVPHLEPWRAPVTWGELRSVLPTGFSLPGDVRSLLAAIRDKRPHYLLLGFPIPAIAGGDPQSLHWLALRLAPLPGKTRNGFRPGERAASLNDHMGPFRDDVKVPWVRSENWSPADLSGRGRLADTLTARRYLVIGGGALGAFVSEMLVRGGVTDLLISDNDTVAAGNLVRHTTTLNDVGLAKGAAVKARLNSASPHAKVTTLGAFPPMEPDQVELVNSADVVIDLTGSAALPTALAAFDWSGERLFMSVSAGLSAQRVFCFAGVGSSFPQHAFQGVTQPWLRMQIREAEGTELPREGIGCWHPVFPARVDDLWLLGAAAMRWIEDTVNEPPTSPELVVFEQTRDETGFTGIRRRTDLFKNG